MALKLSNICLFQGPPKCSQIGIFGEQICRPATLVLFHITYARTTTKNYRYELLFRKPPEVEIDLSATNSKTQFRVYSLLDWKPQPHEMKKTAIIYLFAFLMLGLVELRHVIQEDFNNFNFP
jgi:hypothetical protein